jgi:hypothetical protein
MGKQRSSASVRFLKGLFLSWVGGDVCRASVKLNMKLEMRGMIKDTGLLDTIRSLCIKSHLDKMVTLTKV